MNSRDGQPWMPYEDALLGTDHDRVVAAQLHRSSVAVSNRRKKLGIRRPRNFEAQMSLEVQNTSTETE